MGYQPLPEPERRPRYGDTFQEHREFLQEAEALYDPVLWSGEVLVDDPDDQRPLAHKLRDVVVGSVWGDQTEVLRYGAVDEGERTARWLREWMESAGPMTSAIEEVDLAPVGRPSNAPQSSWRRRLARLRRPVAGPASELDAFGADQEEHVDDVEAEEMAEAIERAGAWVPGAAFPTLEQIRRMDAEELDRLAEWHPDWHERATRLREMED